MNLGEKILWLFGSLPAIYFSSFFSESLAVAVALMYFWFVMLPIWWATIYDKNERDWKD